MRVLSILVPRIFSLFHLGFLAIVERFFRFAFYLRMTSLILLVARGTNRRNCITQNCLSGLLFALPFAFSYALFSISRTLSFR
jgi:hypothetical protein